MMFGIFVSLANKDMGISDKSPLESIFIILVEIIYGLIIGGTAGFMMKFIKS